MTESLDLPPVFDLVAAPALLDKVLQRRGQSLSLDAGHVQRLGAQCLQVLLAARAAWAADGRALLLQNPSDEFIASLELMGLSPEELTNHAEAKSGETDQ